MSSAEALEASLGHKQTARTTRLLPETLVVDADAQPLQLPVQAEVPYSLRIELEDGTPLEWTDHATVPRPLPLGYHRITITAGDHVEYANLIVCPARAHLPPPGSKYAGLGVFLPGVRDAKTWGCGDFRALGDLAEWAWREVGCAYVALNPLHAIHNRAPYNTSPYLPNSVLYRNFIYLDIAGMPDVAESGAVQRLLASKRVQDEVARLNSSGLVDYEGVARL